jgi:hypothetical protein
MEPWWYQAPKFGAGRMWACRQLAYRRVNVKLCKGNVVVFQKESRLRFLRNSLGLPFLYSPLSHTYIFADSPIGAAEVRPGSQADLCGNRDRRGVGPLVPISIDPNLLFEEAVLDPRSRGWFCPIHKKGDGARQLPLADTNICLSGLALDRKKADNTGERNKESLECSQKKILSRLKC